jgi:hypothetical protein
VHILGSFIFIPTVRFLRQMIIKVIINKFNLFFIKIKIAPAFFRASRLPLRQHGGMRGLPFPFKQKLVRHDRNEFRVRRLLVTRKYLCPIK